MATQVQLRRGTAAQNDAFTGAQGELSYDTTNKRLRVHDGATAGGFEIKTEDLGGDISFADGEKAIFGAGSDLQIYHDGNHSIIKDAGTGNLQINAGNLNVNNVANSANIIVGNDGGAVNLYYDGSKKLETTSTGVDITGTLTSDSLTVDGEGIISSATTATNLSNPILQLTGSSYTANGVYGIGFNYNTDGSGTSPVFAGYQLTSGSGNTKGNLVFGTRDTTTAGDVPLIRQTIAPNGDIDFYASDGTTPAFHWDAADERLGIGTAAPAFPLDLKRTDASGGYAYLGASSDGGIRGLSFTSSDNGAYLGAVHTIDATSSGGQIVLSTGGSEAMRISAAGDLELIQSNNLYWKHAGGGTIRAGITADSSDNLTFSTGSSDSTAMTIDGSGNVGIGGISPDSYDGEADNLVVASSGHTGITIASTGSNQRTNLYFSDGTSGSAAYRGGFSYDHNDDSLLVRTAGAAAMTIDSSQNLLVGTDDDTLYNNTSGSGIMLAASGRIDVARVQDVCAILNRTGVSDGSIMDFKKNGSTVGSIGNFGTALLLENPNTNSYIAFHANNQSTGIFYQDGATKYLAPYTARNNEFDLGNQNGKWKDLHLSGGVVFGDAGGSGTSSSNTLDSYEEGSWNPTVLGSSVSGTTTYGVTPVGWYRKIGDMVTVSCIVFNTGHTGSGLAEVNGLPFASNGESVGEAQMNTHSEAFPSSNGGLCNITSVIQGGQTKIHMRGTYNDTTSGPYYVQIQNFTYLRITLTYKTS